MGTKVLVQLWSVKKRGLSHLPLKDRSKPCRERTDIFVM